MEFLKKNKLNLGESITPLSEEDKQKDIEKFSSILCKMIGDLYETYNVLRQDPINKLDDHMMVFQSRLGDGLTGKYHDEMFRLAFDRRINIFDANKQFHKDVEEGKAIPLGDAVITDTALSSILSSNEFRVSISFMLKENYDERERIRKEEQEKLDKL